MKKVVIITLFFALNLLAFTKDYEVLKTEKFTLYFEKGKSLRALKFLEALESYGNYAEKTTGNSYKNLPIVIEDTGQYINAFSNPYNQTLHLFLYEPSFNDIGSVENWHSIAGIHEQVHFLHHNIKEGIPKFVSETFGLKLQPNLFLPGFIHEGITVYTESSMSQYEGRLNDGYYDYVFDDILKTGKNISLLDATYNIEKFPYSAAYYIFGSRFFKYLATVYGESKFSEFFKEYGKAVDAYLAPIFPEFVIEGKFKTVYGKTLKELWSEFIDYEKNNLKKSNFQGEKFTNTGNVIDFDIFENYAYFSRRVYFDVGDGKWRYYELVKKNIETNEETVLLREKSRIEKIKVRNGEIYYLISDVDKNYFNSSNKGIGYVSTLKKFNGNEEDIITSEIRDFEVNNNGIIISVDNKEDYGTILYKLKDKKQEIILKTPFIIDQIDKEFVSAKKNGENYSVFKLEDNNLIPVIDTPFSEGNISSFDGNVLYSANYGKEYNAYLFDLKNQTTYSLTEGGYNVKPLIYKDKLLFLGVNSNGNDIYIEKFQKAEYKLPEDKKQPIEYKEFKTQKLDYSENLKNLFPPKPLRMPYIFYNPDTSEFSAGVMMEGGDVTYDFRKYTMTLGYNFGGEADYFNADFGFEVNYFAPFLIYSFLDYSSLKDEQFQWKTNIKYPLIKSLKKGINNLYAGSKLNFYNNFKRTELKPYTEWKILYPFNELSGSLEIPLEKDRLGLYVNTTFKQIIYETKLELNNIYVNDENNPDKKVIPKIRGYSKRLQEKKGDVISLDYSFPVLKIRSGFWNPNIFFDTLGINLFSDYGTDSTKSQFSTGIETLISTKMFFDYMTLSSGLRFSRNKENEFNIEFFIKDSDIFEE